MIALRLVVALAALWAAQGAAAQEASTNRATELRERPAADAKSIASLPARTPVKVLGREGAWSQVDALTQRGWLPTFHIRFAVAMETGSANPVLGITSMLGIGSRQAPETSKVATIGVRGLTRDDFKAASPDTQALKRLQSYRATAAEAEAFARDGGLAAVSVPLGEGGKS